MQEEGAADKHLGIQFVQLVGQEEVVRTLELLYPTVEKIRQVQDTMALMQSLILRIMFPTMPPLLSNPTAPSVVL